MNDTKALDQMLCRFPDGVTINDVDEFYSTWLERAKAELEELKEKAGAEEDWKKTALLYERAHGRMCEEVLKLRAELEEARKLIQSVYDFRLSEDKEEGSLPFNVCDYYAMELILEKVHPKELK